MRRSKTKISPERSVAQRRDTYHSIRSTSRTEFQIWIAVELRFPKLTSEKFLVLTPSAESQKCVSGQRELGSENGLQIWIDDDVRIPKLTSEKFLAPTIPAESQKCVSRQCKLGSENALQIWIADDVSIPKMTSKKFLAPTPPRPRAKNVYLGNGSSDRKVDFKCG